MDDTGEIISLMTNDKGSCGLDSVELGRILGDVVVSSESMPLSLSGKHSEDSFLMLKDSFLMLSSENSVAKLSNRNFMLQQFDGKNRSGSDQPEPYRAESPC